MSVWPTCVSLCSTGMECPERTEGVFNPLELKAEIVICHQVGARNQIWVLWKGSKC